MSEALQILNSLEPNYLPSEKTAEVIGEKNLIAFVGAFAVGKTTLIETVASLYPDYSEVVSFTTRPSRGDGDRYRFIDHSEHSLSNLARQAQEGKLTNFTVHPTTGFVYGTEPNDYRTQNCMLATTAKSFESDKMLPFETVKPVVVVAQPLVWLKRIDVRATGAEEKLARMGEARISLEWSLEAEDVIFIDNTSSQIVNTAHTLVRILEDGVAEPRTDWRIAAAMLNECREQ